MIETHRLIATLLLLLFSGSALADKPVFGDTFSIGIGGMENKSKTVFRSTREGRPPVDLDLQDLNMDSKASTVWVGLNWQFAESWGVSASYSGFNSDGRVTTSEDGNFGDIDWSANATLTSDLDLNLYIIDLHWDFINTERSHFGAGVGLHIADLSASIGALIDVDINGNPVPTVDLGTETAAVTAPLPNISLRGGHRFGDSFYLGATAGYFSLKVGDIDGELVTFRAAGEWRPGAGKFGLGLGYQYVNINVTDEGSNRVNEYDMEFYGPILFVGVGF